MSCAGIPRLRRKDWLQGFLPAVTERRIPVSGTLELTFRCNIRCHHCYVNLPAGDSKARGEEMSTERALRLIDELADAGTLFLCFSGGEILVRPDFFKIYRRAIERGILVTLFTNATMITPRVADELAATPPLDVEVTLYGRSRETYEAVTGVPGSWARCYRGLDLLLDRGMTVALKSVAIRTNVHELDDMRSFADEKGLRFSFDPIVNGRVDGIQGPEQVRLSPAEVAALDSRDTERRKGFEAFCKSTIFPTMSDMLLSCGAGRLGFFIDPYGKLAGCSLLREPSYDLKNGSFREGWYEFLPKELLARQRRKKTRCTSCGIQSICNGCPGFSYLEHGDPEEPSDWVCDVTHERAAAFNHPGLARSPRSAVLESK